MINDYLKLDGLGLAQAIKAKQLSAAEALGCALTLADKLNPKLNAIVMRHDDMAKAESNKNPDGIFGGVPFLLKNLHTQLKGTSTDGSCALLQNKKANHNSVLTDYFQQAGLVIFGKTNSPELGLTGTTEPKLYGATHNPWSLLAGAELSPAGSSGGAGSAVAAGIVPLAHASDGGGSIRMPAAANGLVGMKPSRGRVSFAPDRGEGWGGMSCNGVVSRSVRDSAAALDAISRATAGEPYNALAPQASFLESARTAPQKLRIAVNWIKPSGEKPDEKIIEHVQQTAKLCASLGHELEEARPHYDAQETGINQMAIIGAHVAGVMSDMGAGEQDVERATWRIAQFGKAQSAESYIKAVNYMHALGRKVGDFHEQYDVYLCPTFAVESYQLGELDMMSDDVAAYNAAHLRIMPFTSLANITGQPAMSMPLCWSEAGSPVGMMFAAALGREDLLFQLAGALEQAQPWQERYQGLWEKIHSLDEI